MKLKKASGVDGILIEAWKYGGEAVRKCLKKTIKRCWRKKRIPEEWNKSIIVPLYKRGEQETIVNYRDISLLCSAYKIYVEIIRMRLESKIEEKEWYLKARLVSERTNQQWITFMH